jgi:hypothetical protein
VALAVTTPATAAVPEQLHYQGVLQNSAGEPIHCPDLAACPDGLPDLTFRLYDQAEGGAAIWEETQADVSIHHGHFQVVLGATSPVGVELLQGSTYLGVEVETTWEACPRATTSPLRSYPRSASRPKISQASSQSSSPERSQETATPWRP